MWKVSLAFVGHRFLLFLIVLFATHQQIASTPSAVPQPKLLPFSTLRQHIVERLDQNPLVETLRQSVVAPRFEQNPFIYLAAKLVTFTNFSPLMAVLILSNLFFLLYLFELNALFNRITSSDIAASATILMVVWPTSIEMNLGTSFSLNCFLTTLVLRHAMDNRWFISGIAQGILALVEPLAIGLLPLALYIFWYFQRYSTVGQSTQRAGAFIIPVALAILIQHETYLHLGQLFSTSAFFRVIAGSMDGHQLGWTFSKSLVWQTLTAAFFVSGALAAIFSNTVTIHRVIPFYMVTLFLVFSPYGSLATRAPLASVCMEGIASFSTRIIVKMIRFSLVGVGFYEVYRLFRL